MRRRWLVSILVILGLALAGSRMVLLAQQPKTPPPVLLVPLGKIEASSKGWKSAGDPQVKTAQAPVPEMSPSNLMEPPPPFPNQPVELAPNDPMVAVDTFLARSRKEADDAIQTLNQEAETLRSRLQKVEAALGRWQTVAGALNLDSRPPQAEMGVESKPTQLESIPQPEGVRIPEPGQAAPPAPGVIAPPASPPTGEQPTLPPPSQPSTDTPPPTAPEPHPAPSVPSDTPKPPTAPEETIPVPR